MKVGTPSAFGGEQVLMGARIRVSTRLVKTLAGDSPLVGAFQIIKSDVLRIMAEELHDAIHALNDEKCDGLSGASPSRSRCKTFKKMSEGLTNA